MTKQELLDRLERIRDGFLDASDRHMIEGMAEAKNDKAVDFIKNVENYVRTNYRITKKQMEALNKVHKRVSEDLFKGDE